MRLDRAAALGMHQGPAAGPAALGEVAETPGRGCEHQATRAFLPTRAGTDDEARAAWRRAAELAGSEALRPYRTDAAQGWGDCSCRTDAAQGWGDCSLRPQSPHGVQPTGAARREVARHQGHGEE